MFLLWELCELILVFFPTKNMFVLIELLILQVFVSILFLLHLSQIYLKLLKELIYHTLKIVLHCIFSFLSQYVLVLFLFVLLRIYEVSLNQYSLFGLESIIQHKKGMNFIQITHMQINHQLNFFISLLLDSRLKIIQTFKIKYQTWFDLRIYFTID